MELLSLRVVTVMRNIDPDPAGALREVYAWISSPAVLTPTEATYRVAHYNQLTEMLRRAIKNAELATCLPAEVRKTVPSIPASQSESMP